MKVPHLSAAAVGILACCLLPPDTRAADAPAVLEEIVVTAPMHRGEAETAHPVNILTGTALRRRIAATLGETLQQELGVSYASFGPGVGQPVIRGQGAPRVLVLQNSLPVADAANVSADHANAVETVLAERIEVLRGPATLLYGGGAIGGVVNVIDSRVPARVPQAVEGALEYRYGSNGSARVLAGRIDAGAESVALHLDGFRRDSGDIRIPGHAHSDGGGEHGRIGNSDASAEGATLGLSWITDRGFIGGSASRLETDHGMPLGVHQHGEHDEGLHASSQAHAAEGVRTDLRQTRYELRSELSAAVPGLELLRAYVAWSDYAHDEIEDGAVGTRFDNRAVDGRIEVVHRFGERLHGAAGVQFGRRKFEARGEEAFVPGVNSRLLGVFVVEDLHLGDVVWEFGARLDRDEHAPRDGRTRVFRMYSASVSTLWSVDAHHTLKFGISRAGRAPTSQELFSDGVHVATASYEIGDAKLDEERSVSMELGWHFHGERLTALIDLFQDRFREYIHQRDAGLVFDLRSGSVLDACPGADAGECLPVRQWGRARARFRGVEAELRYRLRDSWQIGIAGDHVRGTLDGGVDAPRMPPGRLALSAGWAGSGFDAGVRLTRALQQSHTGDAGTAVKGHTLLSAHAEYLVATAGAEWTVFLRGTNLLDREVRNATSLLRDLLPEPGRSVELGLRLRF